MIRTFGWSEFSVILFAAQWTLLLSVLALAGGALLGGAVALARTAERRWFRRLAASYIRLFQGTPLLMQLFLVFFGVTVFGLHINALPAAALALTLHAGAFLGEIWRGCIESVPKGQAEAGWALGLNYRDRMIRIILPQATRIAIAPTVGFSVQLIKGTSLASFVGFVELTRAGQIINNVTFQPFLVFGIVAALYFIICWPLSLLARHLERQLSSAEGGTALRMAVGS
jgi:polar amino acid transport system permease protein